jgi:hypothetical protein
MYFGAKVIIGLGFLMIFHKKESNSTPISKTIPYFCGMNCKYGIP